MNERRNVPEIVIAIQRIASRDPKLGSISSLRCQKSRTRIPKDARCEVMFRGRCLLELRSSDHWSARLRLSGYAGHASPFGSWRGAPREARRAKRGGARRDRTDDLMLAKHALSQLSYGPDRDVDELVGLGGLEPPTSRLSSARSNQLSYKPELLMLALRRLHATIKARPFRRKRNEDGGAPQRRPDWPFDSKNSSREAITAPHRGISLERR